MILTVKYFGMLAEITNCSAETFSCSETKVSGLLELLFNKYPGLKEKDFQVAQDHALVSKKSLLSSNEIALLPPFSGG